MKKIILLFLFIPLLSFNLHKIHVSLTNIVYKKESKTLQITTRLFIDDIENALQKKYHSTTELNTERELDNTDALLQKYFQENFVLQLNDKNITLQFLGKEYDENIVYVYFEMKNIPDFKQLYLKNTLLFNIFDDQQNIVKIKKDKYQKTLFFKANHFNETLTIE